LLAPALRASLQLLRFARKATNASYLKSELAQEHGAAIHIAPNANGLLRRFGLKPEDIGANVMESFLEFDYKGTLQKDISTGGEGAAMWQNPWQLAHRVQLHNELKRMATTKEGKGPPAVLHTSAEVIDIDPQKGTVTLKDGKVYTGDLVLGADGVGVSISVHLSKHRADHVLVSSTKKGPWRRENQALQLRKERFQILGPNPEITR